MSAIVNLHDLIDSLQQNKVFDPGLKRRIGTIAPEQHAWVLGAAKDATCFHLGAVENTPDLKIIPALFKTPYEVVWFEATNKDGLLGLLSSQTDDQEFNVAVFNKRFGCSWQILNVMEVFLDENNILSARPIADFCSDKSGINYSANAINMMARFLMAMNCTNVVTREHKAPTFLNAKRISKGKYPLFSFWTLHLSEQNENRQPALGGKHSSPRLHLRRGHIRQYAEGKYTWVEPCVVGNKKNGMIAKDYSIKTQTKAQEVAA